MDFSAETGQFESGQTLERRVWRKNAQTSVNRRCFAASQRWARARQHTLSGGKGGVYKERLLTEHPEGSLIERLCLLAH
jgi:hypothetical protein